MAKVSQPRYTPDQKERAEKNGLALFCLDLNRRYVPNQEDRVTVQGAASPESYPYLHFAQLVVNGIPVSKAIELSGVTGIVAK